MNKGQAAEAVEKLRNAGHQAVFAGGAVRDRLLDREPSDWDVATSALPAQVLDVFPHSVQDGIDQGVVKAIIDGLTVDVATFRKDGNYSDGRRPDTVEFTVHLHEDASRRDFTINSLYMTLEGTVLDYHNGQADLRNGVIRCVGDPLDRFMEDKLRVMRALRFAAQLGFTIDATVIQGIYHTAPLINQVSYERIRDEFYKILEVQNVDNFEMALVNMMQLGIMAQILPEVYDLVGCEQDAIHHPEGDVWVHSLGVAKTLKEMGEDADTVFGGLLHDIGKKHRVSHWTDSEGRPRISNIGHDVKGAEMVRGIADRFKLTGEQKKKIYELVRQHMRMHSGREMKRSTLIATLRDPYIHDLIALQHADGTNSAHAGKTCWGFYKEKLAELEPEITSPPLVRGQDLIDAGLAPGPYFTDLLAKLRVLQDEGSITTKEQGVKRALADAGRYPK